MNQSRWRFYEEFDDERKRTKSLGTVVAEPASRMARRQDMATDGLIECVLATMKVPNSDQVCQMRISPAYLRRFCRKISEERAREIHPALFEFLEKGDKNEHDKGRD